ncbi:MAG: DUF1499 domain-containing protein [Planctomycetota bacterium]|nr:DUF1499 domain-containing protein [Planctomycetota bacterium]MDA1139461.1 DUF1499 domain-containing protein [Planctomycetota bacterium]
MPDTKKSGLRRVVSLFLIPVLLVAGGFFLAWASQSRMNESFDGISLSPCGSAPNCVCSQDDSASKVLPLTFTGSLKDAAEAISKAMLTIGRSKLLKQDDRYLHYECKSVFFGFVDDIEFLIEARKGIIHVRSASRVGYSDFGANRRRVERIRAAMK